MTDFVAYRQRHLNDLNQFSQPASQCKLHQVALFKPRGLLGLLYWYAVAPFHGIVFHGMLHGIKREALQIAANPTAA